MSCVAQNALSTIRFHISLRTIFILCRKLLKKMEDVIWGAHSKRYELKKGTI